MGFAEIQAAFATQAPAPSPATQPPAPAAPVQFTPSPFGAPPVAAAVQPPAFTPAVTPPPAPAQPAFTFTPPAGFNPASAPPINPPGERAALAAPTPTPAPALTVTAPVVVGATPGETPGAVAFEHPPAEPKRRGRKAKFTPEDIAAAKAVGETNEQRVARLTAMPENGGPGVSLAADGAAIATMPPDGSSVEDIVSELFARGVSSVHLTFTKDGK